MNEFGMDGYIMVDNCDYITQRYPIGLCIVEEAKKYMAAPDGGWLYEGRNIFWIMYREKNKWFPYCKFNSMQKANKRLELIENDTIEIEFKLS